VKTPGAQRELSCRKEMEQKREKTREFAGVSRFISAASWIPASRVRKLNPRKTGKNYGSYREFAHRAPGAQLPGSRFSNLEKFMYGEFGSLRGV
jgi:hypothetical protein